MLNQKVAQVKGASIFLFQFPTVQGFGNISGFEFMLQDRTNGPLDQLGNMLTLLSGSLMQRKEIAYAFTTFRTGNPQYMMEVDHLKAKQLGVSVNGVNANHADLLRKQFRSRFQSFRKILSCDGYRLILPYRADAGILEQCVM